MIRVRRHTSGTDKEGKILPETMQQVSPSSSGSINNSNSNGTQSASTARPRRKKSKPHTTIRFIIQSMLRQCCPSTISNPMIATANRCNASIAVALLALIGCTWFLIAILSNKQPSSRSHGLKSSVSSNNNKRNLAHLWNEKEISELAAKPFSLTFQRFIPGKIKRPRPMPAKVKQQGTKRDYGGFQIRFLEDMNLRTRPREIYHDFNLDKGHNNSFRGYVDDDVDYYYAFDDDIKRNPYNAWDDPKIAKEKHCRRVKWHRDLPIACNALHEFDVQMRFREGGTKYLGAGAYREVYLSNLQESVKETVVFKAYYWGSDFDLSDFEYMRMDAIVAERLSFSNRIVDIYGYCGTGMINEAMHRGDMDSVAVPTLEGRIEEPLNDKDELDVRNKLTGTQKLEYALDMAEAVLLLHGFPDGIIVHDDIQLSQFLLSANGTLKLNDFNRAEIMLWNDKDQEYCRYKNGKGHGDWRAPEEYLDLPLNEKIDIWSIGNNMYSLLTGLYPLYQETDTHKVQKFLIKGRTGYIDPRYKERSFAEAKLAEIIPLCWKYDPDERISIFELVTRLRHAVAENKRRVKEEGEPKVEAGGGGDDDDQN